MYEVYSAQRPGRPRRSLAAAVVLLLLTVAAAQALIWYRERVIPVQLGPQNRYPEGRVSVRLPVGWDAVDREKWPAGAVVGLEPDVETDGRRKRLYVLRGRPLVNRVPSFGGPRGPEAILSMARLMGADALVDGQYSLESVSGFPGVAGLVVPSRLGMDMAELPICLFRAAVGPGGELVGFAIQSDGLPKAADRRLLEQVSESAELFDLAVGFDPQAAMAAAGVIFGPPAAARFIGPAEPGVPRVRMVGGQGLNAWYLDVSRVPLVGGRTVFALVEDSAMSTINEVRLPTPAEELENEGRTAARVTLPAFGGRSTVHVFGVQTDAHTALLMSARCESEASQSVQVLCETIAKEAKVESYDELVDLESAMSAGRRLLREARQEGMAALLKPEQAGEQQFVYRSPAIDLGSRTERCKRLPADDRMEWELTVRGSLKQPQGSREIAVVEERWLLAEDGMAYMYECRRTETGQLTVAQKEQRSAGGTQVDRMVETIRGARRDSISVDESFANELLLTEVAARLARESVARPAIVSTIDRHTAGTTYCVLKPLGKTPLPGSSLRESASTVRLTRDYDPSPVSMCFDDEGGLLAMTFDGVYWQERVDPSLEADERSRTGRQPRR